MFSDRLCFVNLMIHLNSLDFFTFYTQGKHGPHTIVHEHAPNCLMHGKSIQLL